MVEITVAVSKLGYGHLTRQLALCDEILAINPKINFQFIVSDVQNRTFRQEFITRKITTFSQFLRPSFQFNSLNELNIPSTLYSYQMIIDFDTQVRDDVTWGKVLQDTSIVINDIEFFHNSIANKMNIPTINISNFTWSDLLAPIASEKLVDEIAEFEQMSNLNLKLPFSTECKSFGNNFEELGLLARKIDFGNQLDKLVQRKGKPNILIASPVGNNASDLSELLILLSINYQVFIPNWLITEDVVKQNDIKLISDNASQLHNYINGVDLVIGKTGYGIISECASTATPIMYWTRNDYLEDIILSKYLEKTKLGTAFEFGQIDHTILSKIERLLKLKHSKMILGNSRIAHRVLEFL